MAPPAQFRDFDTDHLVVLGLLVMLGLLIALAGRWLDKRQSRWIGRILAAILLSYVVVVYLQYGLAHQLSWDWALPLELCHCVMFACAIALFRPTPLAFEVTYFWGLGGTLQAVLTPDISQGFPSWEFILFFWSHGAVLLAVVYLIACQHMMPRPGSVVRMVVLVNVYALVVGGIDALFGWDYGYLCAKPAHPSLLDYLGPWPWYLVSLEFVALANFLLLALPWKMGKMGTSHPFTFFRPGSSGNQQRDEKR